MDPLVFLPAEIVLRVLEFTSVSGIASLTRLNTSWHNFIEHLHQDAIYTSLGKTEHPPGAKDVSFLEGVESFDLYFEGTSSWRDLCRRQTLLKRNCQNPRPKIKESLTVPLPDQKRVWRFRTDLKRRFFVCTSQDGGLQVTDIDGNGPLWHLWHDEVPPFAHLEYSDGMAVWSTLGDALEVWKTDEPGLPRGEFRKVAALDCPMHNLRGFHLAYQTLCVVGDDGHGLVYDMTTEPPRLRLCLDILEGAVGHLCQAEEIVMYSMGPEGYHIHDKTSGQLRGIIKPDQCKQYYHIKHPSEPGLDVTATQRESLKPLPAYELETREDPTVTVPIEVEQGPHPCHNADEDSSIAIEEDVWGAGLIDGDRMVGISRAGRIVVCTNWRQAIQSKENLTALTSVIECEDNEENFLLGGWLSIRDNRILLEILDKVYFIQLNEDGTIPTAGQEDKRPSWCFYSALNLVLQRRLQRGISMMQLFEDCIVTTCGLPARAERWPTNRAYAVATKGIRILSLAPKLD